MKGLNCTIKQIKYYFHEIWTTLINEKCDDDDENKTFKDKCQQAFQQANIQLTIDAKEEENFMNNKTIWNKSIVSIDNIVSQLNHMLNVINQIKEQINSKQILKIKNNDCKY